MNMKVLSVVCARSGSKGLKNKCMKRINHKPVVRYAIDYSLSLGGNVKTVVSTDIKELIDYCQQQGILYIERDKALCADDSRIDAALADAVAKHGRGCQLCSLVYGNIPTRYPDLFFKALDFLETHPEYDAAITMQNVEKYHPAWLFDLDEHILPRRKTDHYRRQMLPQKMIHDSHTLMFKIQPFMKKYNGVIPVDSNILYAVFGDKIKPVLNKKMIVDIDTERDFITARALIESQEKE